MAAAHAVRTAILAAGMSAAVGGRVAGVEALYRCVGKDDTDHTLLHRSV